MTRAQRNREADLYLCAARHWQAHHSRRSAGCNECVTDAITELWDSVRLDFVGFDANCDIAASAALSEAARLSDTEIVDNENDTKGAVR